MLEGDKNFFEKLEGEKKKKAITRTATDSRRRG